MKCSDPKKIPDLTEASSINNDDLLIISQDSVTKNISYDKLLTNANNLDGGTTQGQLAFWDSTLSKWTYTEISELYWDDTNKILTFGNFPITPSSAPTNDYEVANKKYVDDSSPSIIWGGITGTLSNQTDLQSALDSKLALAGGTMTGFLTLNSAPTSNLHASTKKYVDDQISTIDLSNYFNKTTDDLDDITDGYTYVKSENNFTDILKTKLDGIETGAEVNNIDDGTAAGQMAFWNGSTWTYTETSELFWDDTNKRLGIGTDSLTSSLHIKGVGDSSATSSLNVTNLSDESLLFVRNDGNSGFNTNTPSIISAAGLPFGKVLDVSGIIQSTHNASGSPHGGFVLGSGATGSMLPAFFASSESYAYGMYFAAQPNVNRSGFSSAGIEFQVRNYDNSGGITSGRVLRVRNGNPYLFQVYHNGNVGIGNISVPQNKLDVDGAVVIGDSYAGVSTASSNGLLVEGNVGIGTDSPTEKTEIAGNLFLNTDSNKLLLGAGKDVSIYYDGTDAIIDSSLITASDLLIDCGANKTLELTEAVYRDELNDLIKQGLNNPSSKIVQNFTEATLEYADNATESDYAIMNIQINHDWEIGSTVYPHIHWFQNQNATPNWLIQYRWQRNGETKNTTWTDYALDTNAFTYSSGTLNQITHNGGITPPTGADLSDILQVRIIRDTNNDSGLFSGTDSYTGDAEAVNFDIHIQVNTMGSRQEYIK